MKSPRALAIVSVLLLAGEALAQRRPRRAPRRPPAVSADAGAAPSPAPPPAPSAPELISVPIADVDRMLRQMRVWLFTPPAGSTAYGLGQLGAGSSRVWALLPSCRAPDPVDPRDPCPVDRITMEAEGGGSVHAMDPVGLAPGADARRVQSFVVPPGVRRIHIRVMGLRAAMRYEATVDVERLVDLPPPTGSPTATGFAFDLARYPSR